MSQTPEIARAPASTVTQQERPELSVVIPMFNEADNLRLLVDTLTPVLERAADSFEVVFVDDGSSDGTLDALRRAHELDPRFRAVSFSRNFGKEIAIAAGLDHARGAAVVIMDADLQHPPEMIETFMARWREGYENVYGQRVDRTADSAMRRMLTMRFYGCSPISARRACRRARATSACSTARPWTRCARCPSARASPRAFTRGSAFAPSACRSKCRSARSASRSSAIAS